MKLVNFDNGIAMNMAL